MVLSMSSMHPRSSSGMAVASARRATVTQLTSSHGRCRTRAATASNLNRLEASDLQSCIHAADVTLADQLLHFRWKCVTEATTFRRSDAQHFQFCDSLSLPRVDGWSLFDMADRGAALATRSIPELLEMRLMDVVRVRQSRQVLADGTIGHHHQSAEQS